MNPVQLWRAWRRWGDLHRAWKEWQMKREPAVIASIVTSAAALLGVFGFDLTAEQTAAIIVVANLIAGVVVRSKVTPVSS